MTNSVLASAPSPFDTAPSAPSALGVVRSPALLLRECLAGLVTSLALIPEVISFSFVAGVQPQEALIASVVLGLVMSLLGGRPAMVTAAAGSVALVVGPTIKAHGTEYLLPIVLLAGLIQVAFGATGMARAMRYVPRSVMIGFVNALGILIFLAQVPHVALPSGAVWLVFVLTLALVHFVPRLTQTVPSALVAIVAATGLAELTGLGVPHVSDAGSTAAGLPGFGVLQVPLNLETLWIITPAALSAAFVGLLESLLTAQLVDEMTSTGSNKTRESWALGIANLCAGLYGGVPGCAMIGQTVVNVQLGRARSRVSTAVAALVLLALVTALSPLMARIPMVALAGVMMIVALKTLDWRSLRPSTLQRAPIAETSVMALTVAVTIGTENLALGVAAGVVLALGFHRRLAAQPG